MTKEITKARVLQEIQDKFKLRELEPEVFSFSERVVPTYGIEQHLQMWESSWVTGSISSASAFSLLTVPANERWLLRAYTVTFLSGVYTLAGVYVFRNKRRDSNDFSYLDLTAGQTVSYLITLPVAIVLEPGDQIFVNADGYTSTGNLRFNYDYMKEEIR